MFEITKQINNILRTGWEEEIYNAEQYVLNSSTTAVSTDEPNIDDYPLYSSWLKPVE